MTKGIAMRLSASALGLAGGIAAILPAMALAQQQDGAGIADIIVTANRREEAIQKVGTAVTAIGGESLREQNISSITDLLGRVPSLNVTANGTQRDAETVSIRGQGQTYLAPTGVVNYFAEVPLIPGSIIGNQGGPGTIFDLESLQVLRGPQGTLFGKNTTGGALLLGPKKPVDRFEGWVSGQYGNYNDAEFEAVVNIPIVSDKLMVRVAAKKVDRDGYTKDVGTGDLTLSLPFQGPGFTPIVYRNSGLVLTGTGPNTGVAGLPGVNDVRPDFRGRDYDDRHYWTARIGILMRPFEGVENYVVGYYTKAHNNGTGQVLDDVSLTHPTLVNLIANAYGNSFTPGSPAAFDAANSQIAAALLARQQALGPRRVSLNNDQFYRLKTWSVIDTLSVEISDRLTFRNIFGYQRLEQSFVWDQDGSYLPLLSQAPGIVTASTAARFPQLTAGDTAQVSNTSLLTEEPQVQGNFLGGKLNMVVGAFYSRQKPEGLQATGSYNGASFGGVFFDITTKSKAAYAQASLDFGAFSPALEGLKFTGGIRRTTDEYSGSRIAPGYVVLPLASAGDKVSKTTWTLGLDYQLAHALLFAKVTRGYKAGGFNYAGPRTEALTYGPEYVTSYEIGAKTDFHVGTVPMRFNVSAYQLDYRDIQRANGDNVANGCNNPIVADRPANCAIVGNTTGLDQGAITYNVGKARVRGVEVETVARLFEGFELSGSYSYTKGKYLDYMLVIPPDPATGPASATLPTCRGPVTIPRGTSAPSTTIDLSCAPFPFTPRNQFTVNARYAKDLGDAKMVLSGTYSHADRNWTAVATLPSAHPGGYIDAYDVFNASMEFNGLYGTGLDLRFFMNNIFDTTYRISNRATSLDSSTGFSTAIYNEPRMYGIQLRYRFGER